MTPSEKARKRYYFRLFVFALVAVVVLAGVVGWFFTLDMAGYSAFVGTVVVPLMLAVVGDYATTPKGDT